MPCVVQSMILSAISCGRRGMKADSETSALAMTSVGRDRIHTLTGHCHLCWGRSGYDGGIQKAGPLYTQAAQSRLTTRWVIHASCMQPRTVERGLGSTDWYLVRRTPHRNARTGMSFSYRSVSNSVVGYCTPFRYTLFNQRRSS